MTDYTHNPFASTHSLDTNPFDDPSTPTPYKTQPTAAEASRLEEIRRREADLERREQELNTKADNLRRHGKANWPPCKDGLKFFPACLNSSSSVFPLIFHSIKDEIPEASQPLITRLYQLWLVLVLTLIINMVACIFILLAGAEEAGRDLGASIGSDTIRQEQSLYYYFYFFFGGFHLLFSVYMIIGVPSTGAAGLIRTIQMFVKHYWVAAILSLVATIGWLIQGLGNAYYYRQ
ncbi:hypothetical protein H0H81_002206, partial [Sphagnurus paluster]